ncbi:2-oxo-4-hydroxy-4-carboxy-5-ureidoimidazoline decarboxylase [Methylobacterium aerolatum]|uniref:2-oxo-4-hydroxy-4-carboxy-5-ureidoimidazoline decarboxylase n=1 Tax=Methylobacterium aerolatum TaxID=418708 RepID=A0ABU0I0J1_9HYPH|nr:2-oxo-4-hydroxy-4-carboxy-5-ureidoimidazoline decarboxylase [Methylobacterium aerolatum]MDQ0448101.1 2-oxo-4-hydroxy-4-carboxy-5-ureidoimidazoline decarboxylase [Methylobacterium aerolatum]GJD35771.1 Uric acid degradation bifunctional protein [Methylobacterium aerolatum]
MIALSDLNALPRDAFVAKLAEIYEHSPWVAEAVAGQRPFASRTALHGAMEAVVAGAEEARQLALLRAHPELAGRAAQRGDLTAHSRSEQSGSGLLTAPADTVERIQALNRAYAETFGFPFIIAVKGLDRETILARLEERLQNGAGAEREEALRQVGRIAALRLEALIEPA